MSELTPEQRKHINDETVRIFETWMREEIHKAAAKMKVEVPPAWKPIRVGPVLVHIDPEMEPNEVRCVIPFPNTDEKILEFGRSVFQAYWSEKLHQKGGLYKDYKGESQ